MASQATLFLLGVALFFCISHDSAEGLDADYNYSDPEKWGTLTPAFSTCLNGKRQSPINIITKETIPSSWLGVLQEVHHLESATLVSNGVVVKVELKGDTSLTIQRKAYKLLQIHWHTPSEHRINGVQYPAEQHQVYECQAGGPVAVIGILYKYGRQPNPLISMIQPYLSRLPKAHCEGHAIDDRMFIGKLKSKLIKHGLGHYYRYFGSLTTPPCDERVTWTVLSKVKTITEEQVKALRDPLCPVNKQNSRPVQPLNGRNVQHFDG